MNAEESEIEKKNYSQLSHSSGFIITTVMLIKLELILPDMVIAIIGSQLCSLVNNGVCKCLF